MSDSTASNPKGRFIPFLLAGLALVLAVSVWRGCSGEKADSDDPVPNIPVPQDADSETAKAWDALAIINHINYVVEVVRTYNNVVALQEEYQNISADNLDLNRIPDGDDSLTAIQKVLDALHDMQMNKRNQQWVQRVLTRDLQGAKIERTCQMWQSVGKGLGSAVGGNSAKDASTFKAILKGFTPLGIISACIDTATGVAGAHYDYKKMEHELQGKLEDQQFNLEGENLNNLHKLNQDLLKCQVNLVQAYHLDDHLRITPQDVKKLVECLKDSNRERCYMRMKRLAGTFEVYPPYWHYRAAMALAVGQHADALEACNHFARVNRGLFRNDPIAAKVALFKATALMELKRTENAEDRAAIRQCLETLKKQDFNSANADLGFFCVGTYLSVLGEPDEASAVLEHLADDLSAESDDDLRDYCDLFTKPKERQDPAPNSVDLVRCRMLRMAIQQQKGEEVSIGQLREICERETTSSLEKLFYFGQLRVEDLWEVAKRDVVKINLSLIPAEGKLLLQIPVSWFLLGDLDVDVDLLRGTEILERLHGDENKREHVMAKPLREKNARAEAYVQMVLPVGNKVLEDSDTVRLRLGHVSWPVEIAYVADPASPTLLLPVTVERFMHTDLGKGIFPKPIAGRGQKAKGVIERAEHKDAADQLKENAQYRLDTMIADAQWRIPICNALRASGIPLGEYFCLANRNTADESHPKRDQAIADVNKKLSICVLAKDVLFWNNPPQGGRSTILITAKSLFYLHYDTIMCWDLKDIHQLAWNGRPDGYIIINGHECRFLVPHQELFVASMLPVLESIRRQ